MLSWNEIETRAVAFSARWRDKTRKEKQYAQLFEREFVNIFGVGSLEGIHEFEVTMPNGRPNYIDYLLPGKLLIEMKSPGESLAAGYSQAMSYVRALKHEEQPVLVMVSDFNQIEVYNLQKKHPYKPFKVSQLKRRTRIFGLLAGYGTDSDESTEIELNTSASYKMARIHDALRQNGYTGHHLEVFLVRLLFCLFADDTGIFEKDSFQQYITASKEDGSDLSARLNELFWILNTPEDQRMKTLSPELARFRYINGTIFEAALPPASFDHRMRSALIEVSREFDWTQISPAIFGAMFQGVMDQEARRALGAHYTSTENILKVIRPLFLDALYDEFEASKSTTRELKAFQDKLASLTFLDPACGSGNFLIITYQELRKLEFEVMKLLYEGHQMAWVDTLIKVKPGQFYGIEIEDFPCQVAQLSMLLMKHLMDAEVGEYFGINVIDFPIRDTAHIVHANALQIDWNTVVPAEELDYIIGNPPFLGYSNQDPAQKQDILSIFLDSTGKPIRSAGKIDFVAAWYYKAAQIMQKTQVRTAFVSTNSITQGDQVAPIWGTIMPMFDIKIDFAWRTFKWGNDARANAAVHCVIIGVSSNQVNSSKTIFTEDGAIPATHINPYLLDANDVFLTSRSRPLMDVPPMLTGNRPVDGGHLIIEANEYQDFIEKEPGALPYIKRLVGSREYINGLNRYCLWLVDISPRELRKMPLVLERVEQVRKTRAASKDAGARKLADTPTMFRETINPETAIIVPLTSSENRRYIPMGFIDASVIVNNSVTIIPDANLYHFGVLTSNAHMAWMRTVAGRLKSDYRYSKDIVYNNFVWPDCSPEQAAHIAHTAQGILDARAKYPDETLADLYDDTVMPPDLRRAHQDNDRAVWEAYGRAWPISDESACVAHLMTLYQERIS